MQDSSYPIAYEVHRYHRGKWELDSTYDNRDLALGAAQHLRHTGRFLGVRVIKEWYDEKTGLFKTKVVLKDRGWNKLAREQAPPRNKPPAEQIQQRPAPPPPKRSRLHDPVYLVFIFGGLLLLGVAAVISLRELAASL